MTAATELFLAERFVNTAMTSVAEAIGVANSAIWYFPTKDDLLAGVWNRALDYVFERLAAKGPEDPFARLIQGLIESSTVSTASRHRARADAPLERAECVHDRLLGRIGETVGEGLSERGYDPALQQDLVELVVAVFEGSEPARDSTPHCDRPDPHPPRRSGGAARSITGEVAPMEPISVTIYTDPGCPWGFNAQRQELQLAWHYGAGAEIARKMIVLNERRSSFEERGLSREMITGNVERLRSTYGMPMRSEPPNHLVATIRACRAYVGARIHHPERANLLLRCLRRRAFSEGEPLDEDETIHAAGADADIGAGVIDGWLADDGIERALRQDMADTRAPLPEALALPHRLSRSDSRLRYSTASAVFECADRRVVMPGFQPFAVYEVAVANVAPHLERRPAPQSVEEVLSWAPYPLATAEVAELRGISLDHARRELREAGAELREAASDGYWAKPDVAHSEPRSVISS